MKSVLLRAALAAALSELCAVVYATPVNAVTLVRDASTAARSGTSRR